MNDLQFRTGGDWDSTTLFSNGAEVLAAQLFIELRAGRDDYGNPDRGGIYAGTEMTAIVRPQETPHEPVDILPGRITITFPGHEIVIENRHPFVEPDNTQVWYNGDNVTERVVDVYVDVNAADDVVQAFVTVYKPHWIRADEVITYSIAG